MLEGLLSVVEGPSNPDDSIVRLDSIRFEDNDGILEVRVMDYDCTEEWGRWRIRAKDLRECFIGRFGGELSLLQPDHVLVRQHTDSRQELHFHGVPRSVPQTVGRLWAAHRKVVTDWIPFERFLNSCANLPDILSGGDGLLADGPTFLIEAYADVLAGESLNPSTLAPRPAKWWDGQQWAENPSQLVGLEFGDSFFVAQTFEEEKLG